MDIHIDFKKRVQKIREAMAASNIDLFLATRGKSVNYIGGAFIPWRSVVPVSKDGYVGLNTLLVDVERLKVDSWLEKVVPCAPLPGMELWEVTVGQIKDMGLERPPSALSWGTPRE